MNKDKREFNIVSSDGLYVDHCSVRLSEGTTNKEDNPYKSIIELFITIDVKHSKRFRQNVFTISTYNKDNHE